MNEKRVLPADVYDTFELSALVYGGIGAGKWFESGNIFPRADNSPPVCIAGHAYAVLNGEATLRQRLGEWDISTGVNDDAVVQINQRKDSPLLTRVSWKEYTRELNIVRGDK